MLKVKFVRIPQLGFPSSLNGYLLYSMSLDDDYSNDNNDDEDLDEDPDSMSKINLINRLNG